MRRFILSWTIVVLSCLAPAVWAVNIERMQEGDLDVVRIENHFLVLKVAANSGARICSLVSKADGVDQVWWRGGRDAAHSGGLIDDKAAFEIAPYTVTVDKEGSRRSIVRLDAPANNSFNLTKRITVVEGEPAVHVDYVYTNNGDKPLHTRHMVRNYYLAGGKAGPEDQYFWPGIRGPQSAYFPYGDIGVSHEVMKPWYAVLDTETQTGLAVVVDSPALAAFYNWADGGALNPTIEWIVDVMLAPGESLTVPVTLVMLRGLTGVSDATAACVLDLEPATEDNTLALNARAYPVAPLATDRRLTAHFRYETLDHIFVWEEDGIHFEAAEPGSTVSGRTSFHAHTPGTHIVRVTIRNGKRTLNDFELPVVIGHSTGGYLRGKREGEQSRPLVVLTDRDVERGYVVHWGQRQPPFEPAAPIELTMGADEYESLELGMLALRDMGKVTAQVSAPGWPQDAIEVRTQEGIAIADVRLADGSYALVEGNSLAMPLGAHKAFWFILRSHQVKPGRYSLTFTMHPEHGPVRVLPVTVEVLDVCQAPRDEVSLYLYHTLSRSGSKRHLQILRDHYVRQIEIYFSFKRWWSPRVSVQRDGKGELVVDFSGLDAALKLPREMGFDQVHITSSMWNDDWFSALSEESPDQQERTRHEFVPLFVDHLLELGFKEVVNYVIDEPTVARATAPEFIERVRKLKQAAPRLKLHMTMNHYAPVIVEKLNPYIDLWTPVCPVLITLLADTGKGVVPMDVEDQFGFYSGGWYHTIVDLQRYFGWRAAYHRVHYYTFFAYWATRREWRLYDEGPDGPETTPSLEGMRDGFEDFAYWRQFELMLARATELDAAKLSKKDRAALQEAQRFGDRAFGMSDDSLVPLHESGRRSGAAGGTTVDSKVTRWQLLAAKTELLRQMLALKALLSVADRQRSTLSNPAGKVEVMSP